MEDYVTYEQAVKLKELGFDWECNHYYQDNDKSFHQNFYENHSKHSRMRYKEDNTFIKVTLCSAPTMSQAQKWLREIHEINIGVYKKHTGWAYNIFPFSEGVAYYTYEKALSEGIDEALELLK